MIVLFSYIHTKAHTNIHTHERIWIPVLSTVRTYGTVVTLFKKKILLYGSTEVPVQLYYGTYYFSVSIMIHNYFTGIYTRSNRVPYRSNNSWRAYDIRKHSLFQIWISNCRVGADSIFILFYIK